MEMLLTEIASSVNGELIGDDLMISSISIDTRTLKQGDLYIAIQGANFDGHEFINKAEAAGASAILLAQKMESSLPQIIVKDTRLALAELAGAWKKSLKLKTVAITGSNGKTTVKEMIASILSVDGMVLYTKGNLNNDIGVPLTLLRLQPEHRYAVIEMGANHAGEIAYSSRYVQPDVAVISNIGAAHIEGFGSLQGVAEAKSEIFNDLGEQGVAILNRDDAFYDFCLQRLKEQKNSSFGMAESSDIRATDIKVENTLQGFKTTFVLTAGAEKISVKLALAGQHNVLNALAAAACCNKLGIGIQQIKQGLEAMQAVTGRLQPLSGKKGNLIIDDTYNANPSSVKAALEVLKQCPGKPWFVLGALAEIGDESAKKHAELGELMKSMNVVRLLAIGSDAEHAVASFGKGANFFTTQQQLIDYLEQELTGEEAVLVKGSRSQKMENIVASLVTDFRA